MKKQPTDPKSKGSPILGNNPISKNINANKKSTATLQKSFMGNPTCSTTNMHKSVQMTKHRASSKYQPQKTQRNSIKDEFLQMMKPLIPQLSLRNDIYKQVQASSEEEYYNILIGYLGKAKDTKVRELVPKLSKLMKRLEKVEEIKPRKLEQIKAEKKEQIKDTLIQKLYKKLQDSGDYALEDIQKLRQLQSRGKKKAFHRKLIGMAGVGPGNKLYESCQSEIMQFLQVPHEYATKIALSEEKQKEYIGLKIFRYTEAIVSSNERDLAKSILVLGETGSGKSSFINAMTNYLAGVDLDDNFRYHIVVEDAKSQKQSVTDDINFYYVKNIRNNNVYRIIDTPGFGDTKGIKTDQQTVQRLKRLIKQQVIRQIHAVLFVMKSTNNRITALHQYINSMVADLFGADIVSNFMFVFAHYDGTQPQCLNIVKDEQKGFGKHLYKIRQPYYFKINNKSVLTRSSDLNANVEGLWHGAYSQITKLFDKIQTLEANCLTMTKENIKKKEILIETIKQHKEQIEELTKEYKQFIEEMSKIAKYSQQINKNKHFQFDRTTYIVRTVPYSKYVTKCIQCVQTNCQINCFKMTLEDIKKSKIFDKEGRCTICQEKCSYKDHFASMQIRTKLKYLLTETDQSLKAKYLQICDEKRRAEEYVKDISDHLNEVITKTLLKIKDIVKMEEQLSKICLTNHKQKSVSEYLNILIKNQQVSPSKQSDEKLALYKDAIRQSEIVSAFCIDSSRGYLESLLKLIDTKTVEIKDIDKQTDKQRPTELKQKIYLSSSIHNQEINKEKLLKLIKEARDRRNQEILAKNNPSFFERFISWISDSKTKALT